MKTFVVVLDTNAVRTIQTNFDLHVGDFVDDEIWVGKTIKGGKIVKILK